MEYDNSNRTNASGAITVLTPCTALGPDAPDDGAPGRQQRGTAIAAIAKIKRNKLGWVVPSQSGNGKYVVDLDDGEEPFCTCPDFELRQQPCKHIFAVAIAAQREGDGEPAEDVPPIRIQETTKAARPTTQRNWSAYTAAQINEGDIFPRLLRELCDTVEQPPQTFGRPRLLLGDIVFGASIKVYSIMSGRRAMTDVRRAYTDGLMAKVPSYATVMRYLEKDALTEVLITLIRKSALPLAAVEEDFAQDSTGFATTSYHRWFDHKWGKEIKATRWVKAHLMCGVKTNIVTDVAVTPNDSADAPFLPQFVKTTAEHFKVREVSADKAYLSRANLQAVDDVGGTAFIPFKLNSVARNSHHKRDLLWERAYHFYHLHREEFLEHYHKRSNAETTMMMIKSQFGAFVRAKTPRAQINEALVKVLCHNILVLIKSMFDLGISPEFGGSASTFATTNPAVAKVTQ